MAQNRQNNIVNVVYGIVGNGTKDEYGAISSCILRSGSDYQVNNFEDMIDRDRLEEISNGKFISKENELGYKQALSIVSGMLRGTIEIKECDLVLNKDTVKEYKEEGLLDNYKSKGKAGRFKMYVLNE